MWPQSFDLTHYLDLSKVKFWNSYILAMGGMIDVEWKGCESIGFWTHCDIEFDLTHDLDLVYFRYHFTA